MRSVLMIVAFIFCPGLAAQEQALDIQAELVWVNSDADEHRLMFSKLAGEKWSEPLPLYDSENFITTPTISTDLIGSKLIIWSEQSKKSTVLMSSRKASSDSIWQPAERLNDFKAENLNPSSVIDSNNQLWIFWSSNYEGLDDIYYSRHEGGKWSSPKRVHANNDVPDIQPVASLDEDLNVTVAWKTYDLLSRQYLTVQQLFKVDKSSKNRYKSSLNSEHEVSTSDVILPDFLPRDSAVVLHFPNNQIEQSIRLDLNR